MSNLKTWDIPTGIAADSSQHLILRMKYYVDTHKTQLNGGTRIRPNISTMRMILNAYDEFGADFPVVVSHNAYRSYHS